jgi:hypothetical protein
VFIPYLKKYIKQYQKTKLCDLCLATARLRPRKNFTMENSPEGFSDEKPNDTGASQSYANNCGATQGFVSSVAKSYD